MPRSARMGVSVVLLAWSAVCGLAARAADTQEALHTRLQKTVNLPKGIEANTPLKEALTFLSERWTLDIQVDVKLFGKRGMPNIESQPVMLPRLVNVRLATLLDLVSRQVNGSCMLLKDRIVMVPRSLAAGAKGVGYKTLPVVAVRADAETKARLEKQVSLDKGKAARMALAEALILIADCSEVNIIIDQAAFAKIQTKDIGQRSVELAKADQVRLREVLDKVCAQAKSTYRLEENIIWVVPQKS